MSGSRINSKVTALCRAAGAVTGDTPQQLDIAAHMGVSQPALTEWVGRRREHEPLNMPEPRRRQLVTFFRERGVPVEPFWLDLHWEEFKRTLAEAVTARKLDGRVLWSDFVERHRASEGIRLAKPPGLMLREPEMPAHPVDQWRVGDRVQLIVEAPRDLAAGSGALHAVVLHEAGQSWSCLFPTAPTEKGLRADSAMGGQMLRLPRKAGGYFFVDPPLGPQWVYAVVSRRRWTTAVHGGLKGNALILALDELAAELAVWDREEWRVLWHTFSVAARAAEPAPALKPRSWTGRRAAD
jgi:hypothetical protein